MVAPLPVPICNGDSTPSTIGESCTGSPEECTVLYFIHSGRSFTTGYKCVCVCVREHLPHAALRSVLTKWRLNERGVDLIITLFCSLSSSCVPILTLTACSDPYRFVLEERGYNHNSIEPRLLVTRPADEAKLYRARPSAGSWGRSRAFTYL